MMPLYNKMEEHSKLGGLTYNAKHVSYIWVGHTSAWFNY